MKTISWMGYNWVTKKPDGGEFHLDNPHMYYNDSCVRTANDTMVLDAVYNPKRYVIDGKEYFPEIGIGLITSKTKFYQGKFEICAMLPHGQWNWPAFWLTGAKTWPPEIDIFEGYSNRNGSYRHFQWTKPCAKYAVRTNAWKNVAPNQKSFGQTQHKAFKHPENYNYFTCEWTKKDVKIFFNSHLVRKFDDKMMLSQMNDQGMYVILNNGCRNDAKGLDGNYSSSQFLVKYFIYEPF